LVLTSHLLMILEQLIFAFFVALVARQSVGHGTKIVVTVVCGDVFAGTCLLACGCCMNEQTAQMNKLHMVAA